MTRQYADNRITLFAQLTHRRAQRRVFGPRRTNGRTQAVRGRQRRQLLHVEAEADGGPVAAEHGTDLVVAAASQERVAAARQALRALSRLYGGAEVLHAARSDLPDRPLVRDALDHLAWLASHLRAAYPKLRIGFDLADMSGYAYYSGPRFAVYGAAARDALARGGRYDEVGAVFGRNRPAVGFSLDLKVLAEVAVVPSAGTAIRAPWSEHADWRAAVRRLRHAGETVLVVLPGDQPAAQAFECDRELVAVAGRWVVRVLDAAPALT